MLSDKIIKILFYQYDHLALGMENETNKTPWNHIGFSLLLLCGMLYGAHLNFLEYVSKKANLVDNWFEVILSTMFYTLGDIAIMFLSCVDKVIYNEKFHAFVANASSQMHPNGDMVGLGTLIILICLGIDLIGKLLYKLNTPLSRD
jgi:hypothetical protein